MYKYYYNIYYITYILPITPYLPPGKGPPETGYPEPVRRNIVRPLTVPAPDPYRRGRRPTAGAPRRPASSPLRDAATPRAEFISVRSIRSWTRPWAGRSAPSFRTRCGPIRSVRPRTCSLLFAPFLASLSARGGRPKTRGVSTTSRLPRRAVRLRAGLSIIDYRRPKIFVYPFS
jgi:hypothetical protein